MAVGNRVVVDQYFVIGYLFDAWAQNNDRVEGSLDFMNACHALD